jgi:hypothetical protein
MSHVPGSVLSTLNRMNTESRTEQGKIQELSAGERHRTLRETPLEKEVQEFETVVELDPDDWDNRAEESD